MGTTSRTLKLCEDSTSFGNCQSRFASACSPYLSSCFFWSNKNYKKRSLWFKNVSKKKHEFICVRRKMKIFYLHPRGCIKQEMTMTSKIEFRVFEKIIDYPGYFCTVKMGTESSAWWNHGRDFRNFWASKSCLANLEASSCCFFDLKYFSISRVFTLSSHFSGCIFS